MEVLTQQGGEMFARWGHYMAGVTWIGLLYYFNFVQVPATPNIAPEARPEVVAHIATRALWWFRFGALLTFLTGLTILGFQGHLDGSEYFRLAPGISISTGALMGIIMFLNVWLVIWPAQKIVIANTANVAAGGEADPAAAPAGRKALLASRTNTFFSIAMLWFMGLTSHLSGRFDIAPDAGTRLTYWIVALVLILAVEANALGLIGGHNGPGTKFLEDHTKVIIGGFIFWALFVVLWEVVLAV